VVPHFHRTKRSRGLTGQANRTSHALSERLRHVIERPPFSVPSTQLRLTRTCAGNTVSLTRPAETICWRQTNRARPGREPVSGTEVCKRPVSFEYHLLIELMWSHMVSLSLYVWSFSLFIYLWSFNVTPNVRRVLAPTSIPPLSQGVGTRHERPLRFPTFHLLEACTSRKARPLRGFQHCFLGVGTGARW